MNNTIHVSIASVAFILESEGYQLLKDYLVRIEVSYRGNPDGAEILSDIEARIGELILDKQGTDTVVSTQRIRQIIDQLGLPDGVDPQQPIGNALESDDSSTDHFQRRLYRNTDGARLGGVCGGLAAYFQTDAVWIRLAFCLPLLIKMGSWMIPFLYYGGVFLGTLTGTSFMLYLILWIAIPKAATPRQRLEMTGEKITASSIHRNVSEGNGNNSTPSQQNRATSILTEVLYVLGRILLFCIKTAGLIVGVVLMLGVMLILAGITSLIIHGQFTSIPLQLEGVNLSLFVILTLLILLLPLIIVIYLLLKAVFHLPSRRTVLSILFGIWILILVYVGVHTIRNFDAIHDAFEKDNIELVLRRFFSSSTVTTVHTGQPPVINDTVRVETISVGDSTALDTVRIEYYTE